MAQLQFADIARARWEHRPLKVLVIDPFVDDTAEGRFQRVFRSVKFTKCHHENFEWRFE